MPAKFSKKSVNMKANQRDIKKIKILVIKKGKKGSKNWKRTVSFKTPQAKIWSSVRRGYGGNHHISVNDFAINPFGSNFRLFGERKLEHNIANEEQEQQS